MHCATVAAGPDTDGTDADGAASRSRPGRFRGSVLSAFAVRGQAFGHWTRSRGAVITLLRNTVHFAGQNLWLYALALIPLAQLFALEFSCPIMVALPPPAALPWVAVMGLGGLGAHFCLTKALSLAPASVVTLIALVGALLYGESLDLWVLAGGAVILAANWTNIAAENRGRQIIARI